MKNKNSDLKQRLQHKAEDNCIKRVPYSARQVLYTQYEGDRDNKHDISGHVASEREREREVRSKIFEELKKEASFGTQAQLQILSGLKPLHHRCGKLKSHRMYLVTHIWTKLQNKLLNVSSVFTYTHLGLRLKKEYSYTSTPPLGVQGLFQRVHFTLSSVSFITGYNKYR